MNLSRSPSGVAEECQLAQRGSAVNEEIVFPS